jgi:predicted acyltransferase (DUF342 family)
MSGILSIGNFSATSGLNSLGDASVNGRLFVGADASFGGNITSIGNITAAAISGTTLTINNDLTYLQLTNIPTYFSISNWRSNTYTFNGITFTGYFQTTNNTGSFIMLLLYNGSNNAFTSMNLVYSNDFGTTWNNGTFPGTNITYLSFVTQFYAFGNQYAYLSLRYDNVSYRQYAGTWITTNSGLTWTAWQTNGQTVMNQFPWNTGYLAFTNGQPGWGNNNNPWSYFTDSGQIGFWTNRYIFLSTTNYGVTWNPLSISNPGYSNAGVFNYWASSKSGQYILAGYWSPSANGGNTQGTVLLSTNYGAYFFPISSSGMTLSASYPFANSTNYYAVSGAWTVTGVGMNSTGQVMAVGLYFTNYGSTPANSVQDGSGNAISGVAISTNYGTSFTYIPRSTFPNISLTTNVILTSLNDVFILVNDNTSAYYYISYNNGATWSTTQGVSAWTTNPTTSYRNCLFGFTGSTTNSITYLINRFTYGNSSAVYLNNSYLGLGTTNPSYILDVSGAPRFSGQSFFQTDVSINNRLYVGTDASMGGNLFVNLLTIHGGDVSLNSRLFVTGDVSMQGRLFSAGDVSHNARLYVGSDVSFGGRLYLANDASLNGNVSLANDLTVGGNLYVKTYTTRQTITELSYQLIIAEDISVNGRLFLSNDASINQRLYVGGDVSMQGRLFTVGDTSHNGRLYVGSDASFGTRVFIAGDLSVNGNVNVNGNLTAVTQTSTDNSTKVATTAYVKSVVGGISNTYFSTDVSFANRILVSGDASMSGNLYVGQTTINVGDISANARLYVGSDVSFTGNVNIIGFNQTLYTGKPQVQTWTQTTTSGFSSYQYVSAVSITDNGQGIAGGYSGSVSGLWYTTNYGLTWTKTATATANTGLWFNSKIANNGNAIASSYGNSGLWYSTNYGQTWTASNISTGQVSRISLSSNGLYGTAEVGSVAYLTSNGGQTWTSVTGTSIVGPGAISNNGQIIFIGSATSTIVYSTNGGSSWTTAPSTAFSVYSADMNNAGTYAIVGGNGNGIWYSSNGGQTWTQSNITSGTWVCSMNKTTGQVCVAVNPGVLAGIYISYNYGQTWALSSKTTGIFFGTAISPNGINALVGAHSDSTGVFYSTSVSTSLGFSIFSSDISLNNRLYVGSDVSFGGKLFTVGDVSFNQRLYIGSDASFSGRLFVAGDISFNGNVNVTTQAQTDNSTKVATTAYVKSVVGGISNTYFATDVSMAQRLFVIGDLCLNSRLFLGSDLSMGGRLYIASDLSMVGNITLNGLLNGVYVGLGGANNSTNAAFGNGAMTLNTSASNAVAIGNNAFHNCTNPGNQVAVGGNALAANTNGVNNCAVGGYSLSANNNSNNTSVGVYAMQSQTGGTNTAVGWNSIKSGAGNQNTGVGAYAIQSAAGSNNSALGYFTLPNLTTGANNAALGDNTGTTNTTGSYNTYVGSGANASAAGFSNSTALGYSASITGSNQIVLGTAAETTIHVGDSSFNRRLCVGSDVSFGGNLYVSGIISTPTFLTGNIGTSSANSSLFAKGSFVAATTVITNNAGYLKSSTTGQYVISGGGQNGSTPLYVSSNYGQTWTNVSALSYFDVAISGTGQYVLATSYTGSSPTIYYSTNYGLNYTGVVVSGYPANNWSNIAISSTGQYAIAGGYGRAIYYSSNYGVSWTISNSPALYWTGTAAITDGGYAVSAAQGGGIYYSSNYGQTWTVSNLSAGQWSTALASSNGLYGVAGGYLNNSVAGLYYSSNGGQTWTVSNVATGNYDEVSISSTGQYCIAGSYSSNTGVYYSTNYGQTWTQTSITSGNYFVSVSGNANYNFVMNSSGVSYQVNPLVYSGKNPLISTTDVSINGNVVIGSDISLNNRLYVGSDASFGGRIFATSTITANNGLSVTGTLTLPAASIADSALSSNIVTQTGSQTLTNKTLTGPVISTITNTGTLTLPTTTDTLVGRATTDTLTNKTLTSPTISTITNSGTITIPTGTLTLATLTGSETLTNKTITTSGLLTVGAGLVVTGADSSFNNRLFVGSDVSLGSRLFVTSDTSMNGNLSIAKDMTIGGNLYVKAYTTQQMITELSYQLIVAQDLSVNGRLFLSNDASFNGRLYLNSNSLFVNGAIFSGGSSYFATDVSMASRLFVTNDVSLGGNLFVSKVLKPTTISEPFITNSGTTSPYTIDYSTGATFYITSPPASNFTVNITNVPTDINRTYVITLIITSTTNKTFCNSVQINGAVAITPNYANGIPTSLTTGNVITQSISIQRISVGDVAANNTVLSAITPWY